ncbi:hypothetical protein RP20_CCG000058 [Aedes albopictus]|nr:hypothetical protein RP20_CCG000058 [Aedes albopictus]
MLQKLLLLLGKEKFQLVSFYQKYVDEASRKELKDILIPGRTLLVADLRLCKPKKFGSPGVHTRYQESFS